MAYEVLKLQRRIALAESQSIDLELRALAVEVAVACNVLELSPWHRIEEGSDIDARMRDRLDALLTRLDVLDAATPLAAA